MEQMFSTRLRQALSPILKEEHHLQEIRLRVGNPLLIRYKNRELCLDGQGRPASSIRTAYHVSEADIRETLSLLCQYSLYAYADEMRQGYITIRGGHRVGIAGQTVIENHQIKSIHYVSSMNIRVSHQVKGCGKVILPGLFSEHGLCHTLIISPPGCGKTTLLRDIIRLLSDGTAALNSLGQEGMTVGVVDERSEIGACYQGIPQNDLGCRTDILDNCPKAAGMMMLIRTMAPQVIAVDEIGSKEDITALREAMACGCHIIATAHGWSAEDVKRRLMGSEIEELPFERYILLPESKDFKELPQVTAARDIRKDNRENIPGRRLCG